MTSSDSKSSTRRHDLDALRAFAMLLGIVLHASLSFTPGIWPVQDRYHNDAFSVVFSAIHGFRMPLFFLASGFFTAMLWRKRGLRALLKHRFKRIFLPLALGMVTIIPLLNWTVGWAMKGGGDDSGSATDVWAAAAFGDIDAIQRFLSEGTEIDAQHPMSGAPVLSAAVVYGQAEAVQFLIDQGADVDAKGRDGATPLHIAAIFGRAESARRLLEAGADPRQSNPRGQAAADIATTMADWGITESIAKMLQVDVDRASVEAGRAEILTMLQARDPGVTGFSEGDASGGSGVGNAGGGFFDWLYPLFLMPVFHHLWFLWFLCWLVPGFALVAYLLEKLNWRGPPGWMVVSPFRFLWLIPLTLIPQAFMGLAFPMFGPDTSAGWLPLPQVLLYYAIFFGFGALYFESRDEAARVGKAWPITLPLTLLLLLPLGLEFTHGSMGFGERLLPEGWHRGMSMLLQVSYAWMMCFALLGAFRSLLSRERRAVRYVSDASYWLYVTHLPLVFVSQALVRDWAMPTLVKFSIICVAVTGLLLLAYHCLVRYTWLGTLLNGPRRRPDRSVGGADDVTGSHLPASGA